MSSVNEKMTAIADVIRVFTGKQAKLSLDAMKQGIYEVHDDGYSKGYIDGIPHGRETGYSDGYADGAASKLFEVHKITIASDLTSDTHILLAENEFAKEHCMKDGFSIQVISLQTQTVGPAMGYANNGNRMWFDAHGYTYYGITYCLNVNSEPIFRTVTGNSTHPTYSGGVYVNATSGNVRVYANANNATWKAGDYLVILSVAEVE